MGSTGTRTSKDIVRQAKAILAVVLLAALATGCGDSRAGPETVRGVVLEVKGDLTSVESFVIRTDGGELLEVVPAPEGDFRFPLPHLHDHLRTSEPILVELDRTLDPPLATSIQDADDPAWHTGAQTTEPVDTTHAPDHAHVQPEPAGSTPAMTMEEPDAQQPAEPDDVEATGPEPGVGADDGGRNETPADTGASPASSTLPSVASTIGTTTTLTTEPPGTTAPSPTTQPLEQAAPGHVIELLIVDGALEGGARRESVALGDKVTVRVSGNTQDEVHVHGYDLYIHLLEGAGELTFEAAIPGVFEIELEGSHTLLVRLEVS